MKKQCLLISLWAVWTSEDSIVPWQRTLIQVGKVRRTKYFRLTHHVYLRHFVYSQGTKQDCWYYNYITFKVLYRLVETGLNLPTSPLGLIRTMSVRERTVSSGDTTGWTIRDRPYFRGLSASKAGPTLYACSDTLSLHLVPVFLCLCLWVNRTGVRGLVGTPSQGAGTRGFIDDIRTDTGTLGRHGRVW